MEKSNWLDSNLKQKLNSTNRHFAEIERRAVRVEPEHVYDAVEMFTTTESIAFDLSSVFTVIEVFAKRSRVRLAILEACACMLDTNPAKFKMFFFAIRW